MMRGNLSRWVTILMMGGLLYGSGIGGCTDSIRDLSNDLDAIADGLDGGGDDNSLGDFINDLEDLFD